ncbi:lipopolysaccharide biosynthesis protein [Aliarcobacter butzleri]|uniref:lipopolysaccharide biosynthesis protein n=1 Tax=Aliarcobacter butzleri TaxID=28197 RepID=UPI002B2446B7|nr:oligosaccharide flippase family protein [Aliarcobacter butzleri]
MLKILSQNIIIYGATNGIKSLVPFLMLPILTIHLSVEDFGILSLVEVVILFLAPIVSLNIASSINVEYFKLEKKEFRKYMTNAFLLSFISFLFISFIFIIFSKQISNMLDTTNTIVLWLPLFALLRVSTQVVLSIFQVSGEPKKFAIFSIGQTLLDFSLSYIFVVFYQYGYVGRLEGIYIAFFVFSILSVYILYKRDFFSLSTLFYSRDILSFGIPLIPHAIGGTIMAMSDRFFISYFYNNEYVGYYTASYQVSALMLLVGMSVNQAWTPLFFKMLKDKVEIKKILNLIIIVSIFFLFCMLVIGLLRDFIFDVLVDEKFFIAKEYFYWLLLGFFFQSLYFLATNFLFYFKKTKLLASITFFGAILNIILNYIFIKYFGVIGVAYATAVTWFIYLVFVSVQSIKTYKNSYRNDYDK